MKSYALHLEDLQNDLSIKNKDSSLAIQKGNFYGNEMFRSQSNCCNFDGKEGNKIKRLKTFGISVNKINELQNMIISNQKIYSETEKEEEISPMKRKKPNKRKSARFTRYFKKRGFTVMELPSIKNHMSPINLFDGNISNTSIMQRSFGFRTRSKTKSDSVEFSHRGANGQNLYSILNIDRRNNPHSCKNPKSKISNFPFHKTIQNSNKKSRSSEKSKYYQSLGKRLIKNKIHPIDKKGRLVSKSFERSASLKKKRHIKWANVYLDKVKKKENKVFVNDLGNNEKKTTRLKNEYQILLENIRNKQKEEELFRSNFKTKNSKVLLNKRKLGFFISSKEKKI